MRLDLKLYTEIWLPWVWATYLDVATKLVYYAIILKYRSATASLKSPFAWLFIHFKIWWENVFFFFCSSLTKLTVLKNTMLRYQHSIQVHKEVLTRTVQVPSGSSYIFVKFPLLLFLFFFSNNLFEAKRDYTAFSVFIFLCFGLVRHFNGNRWKGFPSNFAKFHSQNAIYCDPFPLHGRTDYSAANSFKGTSRTCLHKVLVKVYSRTFHILKDFV